MNTADRDHDIATRYLAGEKVRDIFAAHEGVSMKDFYAALRKAGVPKRGKGAHLKGLWKTARDTGVMPEQLQKAFKDRKDIVIKGVKKPKPAKTPVVKDLNDGLDMTIGMKAIGALVAAGTITEDDVKRMASAFTIVPLKAPAKPVERKRNKRNAGMQAKYDAVIRAHKKGKFTIAEISMMTGASKSSVFRFVQEYKQTA